jgi:hypothetical protein
LATHTKKRLKALSKTKEKTSMLAQRAEQERKQRALRTQNFKLSAKTTEPGHYASMSTIAPFSSVLASMKGSTLTTASGATGGVRVSGEWALSSQKKKKSVGSLHKA